MKCPACYNELKKIQAGWLEVDVCHGGCGGIWFDNFELKRVDEEDESVSDSLLQVPFDPAIVVDLSRKRECPRCAGVKLHRHFFSVRRKVQVDQCPNCAGYWLDAGELADIRKEQRGVSEVRQAAEGVHSSAVLRYLYDLHVEVRSKSRGEAHS